MSNIRDYGAAGDGQTDDTAAIQHALSDGEGLIEFPRGDYRITKPIVVDLAKFSRTAIRGSGGTAKLIMAGKGPALFFAGSHDKNADPNGFKPEIWQRERMPLLSDIEITGDHPEADGVRLEGVMQPTLAGVLIRKVRNAVHVTRRSRNVLISHCHIYQNTGIGVFLDHCNLHQTIITGSHISYCRLGGIRIQGGEIRNFQVTGNDIEYNNNRAIGVPGADAEPTAEIYIDVEDGTVREGTICSNTIQATYSPNGANIRFVGSGSKGNHRAGMWTIAGNLIGSQATNIHLTSALGFAISGNYIYSGHERNIVIEGSRSIAIGANTLGHNPDYGDKELSTGIRFVDCEDCTVTGLIIQDALAGQNTVAGAVANKKDGLIELIRCRRMNLTGCQILEGTPNGLVVEDCADTLISGCTVLDRRSPKLMEHAIVWRDTAKPTTGNLIHGCRIDTGSKGNLSGVNRTGIRASENVLDRRSLVVPIGPEILPAIRQLLTEAGLSFREVHHGPTRTSEESAKARGEELRIGGKALLMKGDDGFRLFVLPADRKLDSGAIRREFGWKKMRFASPEELNELTGLVPGSVPPFGPPILPFELCLDQSVTQNPRIAFNAGSLTDSIILLMNDYFTIAKPSRVFAFSEAAS